MAHVPRRAAGGGGHAAIRTVNIEVIFQLYPGTEAASAISGLNYQVTVGGGAARNGTTGADGKVTIRLRAGQVARLNVMGTEYRLRLRRTLEPVNDTEGIQRRLNMLGYQTGIVDGDMGPKTEHAVLNFQADNNPLKADGLPGPNTRARLRTVVGE